MAGAAGYVLKQINARDLIDDVKKVAGGASLMDPRAVAKVVERISNPPKSDPEIGALSPQEQRLLDLIAEGLTNRQIAEAMFLAEHTVKNYMTTLLRKLKMSSRTEAAIYATKLKAGGSRRVTQLAGPRSCSRVASAATAEVESGCRPMPPRGGPAPRVGAGSSDRPRRSHALRRA